MQVDITTLSENTASYGCIGEWGLSILVETGGSRVLLDTGLSFSAVHKAGVRRVDLSGIDRIVLSHGHVDHTGGLAGVLAETGEVEVIAHPDVFAEKCARRGEVVRDVGIPFSREELEALGARFSLTSEPVRITDRVMTTGEVPMSKGHLLCHCFRAGCHSGLRAPGHCQYAAPCPEHNRQRLCLRRHRWHPPRFSIGGAAREDRGRPEGGGHTEAGRFALHRLLRVGPACRGVRRRLLPEQRG